MQIETGVVDEESVSQIKIDSPPFEEVVRALQSPGELFVAYKWPRQEEVDEAEEVETTCKDRPTVRWLGDDDEDAAVAAAVE